MRQALILMLAATAGAQVLVGPGGVARAAQQIRPKVGEERLTCELTPIPPTLSYSLRYLVGYNANMRLGEFRGAGHVWNTLVRVTPFLKDPVYLRRRVDVPEVPMGVGQAETAGGFFVGIGHYQVTVMVYDERGRACRNDWDVDVRDGKDEGRPVMLPNTVAEMSLSTLQGAAPAPAVVDRLTLLVNAGPIDFRRLQLNSRDGVTLCSAVSALLEKVPARTVKLIVFNLDKRRVLFQRDEFQRRELDSVADAIHRVQLALVDVQTLQDKTGDLNFLATLMNAELRAEKPSDLAVFLGPRSRAEGKIADGLITETLGAAPRFYFVELMRRGRPPIGRRSAALPVADASTPGVPTGGPGGPPPGALGGGGGGGGRGGRGGMMEPGMDRFPPLTTGEVFDDAINKAVSKAKGKTYRVTTPAEFAKALVRLVADHVHK